MRLGEYPFEFPSVFIIYSNRIEIRKDGARRRNTSGPRPLSSINDANFDAFDLLGIEKGETGQDLSYGHLLIPSRHHHKEKKNPFPFSTESELTNAHLLKNYGFGRCSTYDGYTQNRILSTSPSALNSSADLKQTQIDEAQDILNETKFNMVCSSSLSISSDYQSTYVDFF